MGKNIFEFFKYVFYGVIAALINTLLYAFFSRICNFSTVLSTGISWLLANVFAYIFNKILVFKTEKQKFSKIILSLLFFLLTRLVSGLGDMLTMYIFVDKLQLYDIAVKILSSGFFGIINYLLGKFIIFKK